MTPPEAALWIRLRGRRPGLPAFRRQHPMGPYILDFYSAPIQLAVEVDGQGHATGSSPDHDARRDAWLRSQGVMVIRYAAEDILRDADEVAHQIHTLALSRIA